MTKFKTKAVGDRGEILVANLLKANGWQVVATQWRCRWGEIDVIAHDQQSLIFVEVKTRHKYNWDEDGSLAITPSKQQKIIKTASIFLSQNPDLENLACRFDVALVYHHRSDLYLQRYIEHAFMV